MVCGGIQQPFSDLPSEYRVMRTRVLGDYNVWLPARRNHIAYLNAGQVEKRPARLRFPSAE
jgi:hypothetical protein